MTLSKQQAREACAKRRRNITCRKRKDTQIANNLLQLLKSLSARKVFIYVSMSSEVDTVNLIKEIFDEFEIFVPFTDLSGYMEERKLLSVQNLTTDRYGNVSSEYLGDRDKCDVAVIPLLAFNDELHRIGYGKGCYDAYLSKNDVYKIGLAYLEQRCDFVPSECDVALDAIVTQNTIFRRKQ